jgi:NAD-dependent dihydropyrimidine dehydrogenase PreA subunit
MADMKQAYLKDVTTLQLDNTKCIGCGRCREVCPHGVFAAGENGNGRKVAIANKDACMECGACARNCPVEAVTVRAGVGCAWAITRGMLTGKEASCGCGEPGEDGSAGKGSVCCG